MSKSILVADDEEGVLRTVVVVLQRAGYKVTAVTDGSIAVRTLRSETFDLLITDILMTEMEGIETIMTVRQMRPELKIIAMSGGGRLGPTDYLQMASKLGVYATLTKPFTHDSLVQTVQACLGDGPAGA